MAPAVRVLVIVFLPVTYPISKACPILLSPFLVGHCSLRGKVEFVSFCQYTGRAYQYRMRALA
ncbi:hypothetical protein M758_UG054200 [Ceratodon purpureus]|nr:hypothetical protein M758_UG054200 [Ceratodon purpureus]